MQGLSTRKNHLSDISLLVCTWNVGNKCPDAAELEHWLPVNGEGYDIIVVGTQENAFSEKKSNRATIVSSADASSGRQKSVNLEEDEELHDEKSNRNTAKPDKEDHTLNAWEHMCLEHLGIGWAVLAHVVLREMRLTVYTTTALEETAVHNVVVASAATGLGGVIGNKGGLVARFSVGHTSLGFCSCHLAAHEGADYARQRNAMCRKVLVKTAGGKVGGFDRGPGRSLKTRHLDIAHSVDHLIWLGDLNYRIDLSLTGSPAESKAAHVQAVTDLAHASNWDALYKADGLLAAQTAREAFVGFTEGLLHFKPTFKVQRQKGTEYKAQRTPSYCDRILWKSMPNCEGGVASQFLRGVPDVSTSDHKPVVGAFKVAPSKLPEHTQEAEIMIEVDHLHLRDILAADLSGTSDPFCRFYSHPPGLLRHSMSGKAPVTPVKWYVGRRDGVLGSCVGVAAENVGERTLSKHECRWAGRDLGKAQKLYLHVPLERIHDVCLLVAVYDFNRFRKNEALGVVTIPLRPPAGVVDPAVGFTLDIDTAIVFGHSTADTGTLATRLRVGRHVAERRVGLMGRLLGFKRQKSRSASRFERSGDYVQAATHLEQATSKESLDEVHVGDAAYVREQVQELTKLAEMRWRYRVVESGKPPQEEALAMLDKANKLIDAHIEAVAEHPADAPDDDDTGAAATAALHAAWAAERSAVLHGMCATHLIFGYPPGACADIEAKLRQALTLRQEAQLLPELGDTWNSLGMLKQQQGEHAAAAEHYAESLRLRRTLPSETSDSLEDEAAAEAAHAKAMAIGQSLVSLGNLATERGDRAHAAEGGGELPAAGGAAAKFYADAQALLVEAKDEYVQVGGEMHPKVAWAHEGLGRLSEKTGDVDAAIAAYEKAASIRRSLQKQEPSKELFAKELSMCEERIGALQARKAGGAAGGLGTVDVKVNVSK